LIMQTEISFKLTEIESEYLNKGMPAQALAALDKIDYSGLSRAGLAHYILLKSEAKLRIGKYDIDSDLFEAIAICRSLGDNRGFAQAKYLLGCLFCCQGRFPEAHEVLIESYVFFKNCEDSGGMARALNQLAYLNEQNGKIDIAMENLRQCIAISKELKISRYILKSVANLAQVYLRAGLIDKAIAEFLGIKQGFENISGDQKCTLNLRLALAKAIKHEFDEALALMDQAKSNIGNRRREEALYYEYMGWIYNLDGKFEGAKEHLKNGIKLSEEIAPDSSLISQTKRLLADAYIGLGKFKLAEKEAREALAVAEKINERAEIGGCYRIFAQVEASKGHKEKAREWYKKAMDMYALISSRYELAVTRYMAAKSGLHSDGESKAMLYLAREYFKAENIKPFIDKTNDALLKNGHAKVPDKATQADNPTFIAVHPESKKVVELTEHIAQSELTVFLTGPTGSGKDQLARYIHHCSGRKGEFVMVNTAAIPESMIESELFGYKKGAFTGADQDKVGLFEAADKGTIYLNEIADSTPSLQAKLLEVIETKGIRRLGDTKPRPIDIRIITATNHDLDVLMKENKFRFDLYHRLNEVSISLTLLDDRKDDIPALVAHFLNTLDADQAKNHHKAIERLGKIFSLRSWSGNVRQLRSEINRLWVTSKKDMSKIPRLALASWDLSEPDKLLTILNSTNWNRYEAARIMGVSEGTIRARIKKYGLTRD